MRTYTVKRKTGSKVVVRLSIGICSEFFGDNKLQKDVPELIAARLIQDFPDDFDVTLNLKTAEPAELVEEKETE